MWTISQNPVALEVLAFFCTGGSLWAGALSYTSLGEGEKGSRLICRSLEGCVREPSSSQCPLLQLMTKETPDSLSPDTYGNFDTQVKIEKLAKGHSTTHPWFSVC